MKLKYMNGTCSARFRGSFCDPGNEPESCRINGK
jgi:hypothetical protein